MPQASGPNQYQFGVVRFASDGTPDTTFNGTGEATDDWGDHLNHATSVAIEPDGAIVVAGYDAGAAGDLVDLVRFLPDGSLDPNFGARGQIETGQPAGAAYSVAIQPDNMIVVGGGFAATLGGRMDFGLARFDNSGAIDAVFGSYGVSAQDLGGAAPSAVTALALQPDGDILAAGGGLAGAAVDRFFAGQDGGAALRVDGVPAGSFALPTSGDAAATANDPYTLTLGDGTTDLGSGDAISYVVHWGDGLSDTYTAGQLASQDDQVTHTYTTIATQPIAVDLVAGAIRSACSSEKGSPCVRVGRKPLAHTTSNCGSSGRENDRVAPSGFRPGAPDGGCRCPPGAIRRSKREYRGKSERGKSTERSNFMPILTEQEQQEIIRFVEADKPLPDKYRFLLFEDKREVELVCQRQDQRGLQYRPAVARSSSRWTSRGRKSPKTGNGRTPTRDFRSVARQTTGRSSRMAPREYKGEG
jgi:uncharacterized delta-60 repeat protein